MDEWYIQEPLDHKLVGTPLNPLFDQFNYQGRRITSLDEDWELDAAADDNEAFDIEREATE